MFEDKAYIEIERRTGSLQKNMGHLLFYSIPKSQWFVAVINKTSKKIVTVHAMNNGIRWSVTDEQKEEVRLRALRHQQSLREPQPAPLPARAKLEPQSTSDDFRFYARINGQLRLLLSVPRHEGRTLRQARLSPDIRARLRSTMEKKIRRDETVDSLVVKDMQSGKQETFAAFLLRRRN